jgi:hypothetical protein
LPQNTSYYSPKDNNKATALEVIDPGCSVCANLFRNIKDAGFENKYNLTYIAFPIENPKEAGKYKFANSYTIAKYLESIKMHPLSGASTPADWQILERIFTWKADDGTSYQIKINSSLNQTQTQDLIRGWLGDIGYSPDQIEQIEADAKSQKVVDIIAQNRDIVQNKIKTVSIPTIIFNGQRHSGIVGVDGLR